MDNANLILIGMATFSSAPGDDSAVAVETEQGTVGNTNATLPSWSVRS